MRSATLLFAAVGLLGACKSSEAPIGPEPGKNGLPILDATVDVTCPASAHGAKLVKVPAKDGSFYCIDQREVTAGEYAEFMDAKKGDMSGQIPGCEWNAAWMAQLIPSNDEHVSMIGYCVDYEFDPVNYPDHATGCADWCDAHAYCAWAGKRLCGAIGGKLGNLADVNDPAKSEWANACTQGGTTKYPWGDSYTNGRCIDYTAVQQKGETAKDVTAPTSSQCHGELGGFADVYDLVGSVQEWTNECEAPGKNCALHGYGSMYSDKGPPVSCEAGSLFAQHTLGFRCCSDVVPGGDP